MIFENIVGNEAFAHDEQVLHFPHCLKIIQSFHFAVN